MCFLIVTIRFAAGAEAARVATGWSRAALRAIGGE
jgi:hypothetical protein